MFPARPPPGRCCQQPQTGQEGGGAPSHPPVSAASWMLRPLFSLEPTGSRPALARQPDRQRMAHSGSGSPLSAPKCSLWQGCGDEARGMSIPPGPGRCGRFLFSQQESGEVTWGLPTGC